MRELIFFLADNCPHPQQSLAETEKILDRLATSLEEEITANLAERDDYRGDMYVKYLNNELECFDIGCYCDPDADNVEMFVDPDLPEEENGYRIFQRMIRENIFDKEESPEVKKKKVKAMGRAMAGYHEKIRELLEFAAQECFEVGAERLRLRQKKDGLSSELERIHEDPYRFALGYQITADIAQEIRNMKFKLRLIPVATGNLIEEIGDNREANKKAVAQSYLQLLKSRMSRELKLAEELSAPFCQFPAEVDEIQIRNEAGWAELQDLLQQVQSLRLISLKKICRHLDLQLKAMRWGMILSRQADDPETDHQNFLMLIMDGTINRLFSREETEGALRQITLRLDIPEAEILQKIENLHHPDRMTEEELADFHLVRDHLEMPWHRGYTIYFESEVINNFPETIYPLKEFEKFLETRERWGSRNFA